jgi:16S rRNA (cytosine967-C5)-methyltransferase
MIKDPRHIALRILIHLEKKKLTLDRCLDTFDAELSALSRRDRNLCNALVYGTLRTRSSLDWVIARCSSRAIEKTDPYALNILRIALYQIVHMDRIPVSAAVNTAVDISKKTTDKRISGFVNAVLRKASRDHASIVFPSGDKSPSLFLAVTYSIPEWLVRRWITRYSAEKTEMLCRTISTIPLITVRTNTLKSNRTDLFKQLEPRVKNISLTRLSDQGISFVSPDDPVHEMESFKAGWFQIQDEAAQLVTRLLDPQPGETVMDACAGLGGKTGHIAQLMRNTGRILAADTDRFRLDQMSNALERLGVTMATSRLLDLSVCSIREAGGYFDRILLDAPCTGLGVLRRNPDARWTKTLKDITRLAAGQKKLLNNVANLVKPGGTLLYTVCSCEPEENEGVVLPFLEKRKDYSLKPVSADALAMDIGSYLTSEGFFRSYPDSRDMDGFFAALLMRKAEG